MKKLLLIAFLSVNLIFADDDKTKSTLTNVTVYLSGAQITRTSNINLPNGTTEFTFGNLSPYIQESSIQISGLKNASILSINYGINYLSKHDTSTEIESLNDNIKELKDKIRFEDDLISGYNEELSVIQSNRRLGNENEVVSLEKLQQFAAYYRKRITAIKSDIYASEKKKIELNKEIIDFTKQLNEFNGDDKVQTGEIKIKLNTEIATSLSLIIKYNVTNAGWFPIYDLKAEKINTPLQLAYKAHVYQTTGTNWDDVKLTLSTSDPNTNNVKPDLNPKYLNYISRYSNYNRNRATRSYNYKYNPLVKTVSGVITDNNGLPLSGANVIVKGTSRGISTDFDGKFSLNVQNGKELSISYLGYKSEILPIHSSIMNVSLDEDQSQLDEVVVTALSGKVSGVQISNNSGAAGSFSRIVLRGASSIKGNAYPLYVVDGFSMSHNETSNLNPDNIKNIEVLKEANASALYGVRGSNGVVIIKTKKGEYTSNGDVIEQGITNTRFEIKKEYSIPTDGDITVIEIDKYSVPATYAYFTAPVINENVFLTTKIGNWEQYNLLPGEANVYFEGSYSGKTNINPQATTDSLTVSLGVDPNVVVKRNQLNDFKKTNFIGNNKIFNKAYEIELKNNKASNIDLVLVDRIPISQNREIKLEDIETGTSKYDSKKGLMEWKVNLSSKETKKYKFSYTVKYPKFKRVNL